jgi:hypothetical protein
VTDARTVRLQRIASRWPRFAWDYRGLARRVSFDESYWTAVLAAGILIAVGYFDLSVWWKIPPPPLPILDELGGSSGENLFLAVLLFLNVWILDRLLAARIPAGWSEVRWLRVARRIASSIPLAGLAVIPLWQWLTRNRPSWAFVSRSTKPPLFLDGRLPSRFGPASIGTRIDVRLRSWSQRLIPQILWFVGCQITPLFSGLYWIGRTWPAAAVAVNILLHLAGAASAAAHATLRSKILQMTGGRAVFFWFLPLGLLVPVPFSLIVLSIWFFSAKPEKEDKGVVQTLYRTRSTRRHPFAAVRGPRMGEIIGSREFSRRRASAVKIGFLALESAVVAGVAATFGSPLFSDKTALSPWMLLLALPFLPGAFLLVAGAVARTSGRWARFAFLADHPYSVFLIFLPLALLLGTLVGTVAGSGLLRSLLALVGFAGILMTLLAMMWTFLLSLFFGVPERPSFGIAVCFSLSILLMLLALNPPVGLLAVLTVLASPLAGILVASSLLAPFRGRDLNDRRLPAHLRVRLWGLAVTAILPLGGLAVPAWIRMRHRHGPELDQWAAQLREPAA